MIKKIIKFFRNTEFRNNVILSMSIFLFAKNKFALQFLTLIYNSINKTNNIRYYDFISTCNLKKSTNYVRKIGTKKDTYYVQTVESEIINCEINIPDLGYYNLKNVIININSPVFFYTKKVFYPELLNEDIVDFILGNKFVLAHNRKKVLLNLKKLKIIENGIILNGSFPLNWFHWMIEILPKIEILYDDIIHKKDIKIYVSSDVRKSENHIEVLRTIGIFDKVEFLDPSNNYLINNAILIDSPFLGNPSSKYKPFVIENKYSPSYYFDRRVINSFTERIKKINIITTNQKSRLFLGRQNENRKYNEKEVFGFFEKKGFSMIYCETISLKEQISIFSKAEMVVGPTGASWTNIIFCNKTCKALCWAPLLKPVQTTLCSILAELKNLNLKYLYFNTIYTDWVEFMKKGSYYLDNNIIKKSSEFLFK